MKISKQRAKRYMIGGFVTCVVFRILPIVFISPIYGCAGDVRSTDWACTHLEFLQFFIHVCMVVSGLGLVVGLLGFLLYVFRNFDASK
jgi:hypothetical protein